ncbi:MAG: hypothetical protein GX262_13870, partial [Clostridia bacterium]|nr:hypothetical protein [Clostridia bacterium]
MELGISLILVVVLLLIIRRSWDGTPVLGELRDVPLDPERLRHHAGEIAKSHKTASQLKTGRVLLKRLEANYSRLSSIYRYLNEKAKDSEQLSPASEWILDNYYIIEEQAKDARQILKQERFAKLRVLDEGYLKGYPRIYAIALELISHTDGRLEQAELIDFLKSYQEHRVLSMAEIWSLPLMLRVALLEYLRHLADKVYQTEQQGDRALELARLEPEHGLAEVQQMFDRQSGRSYSSLVVQLLKELRKKEQDELLRGWLEQYWLDFGTDLDSIIAQEHFEQASRKVAVGHAIMSLKTISLLDWEEVFENLSRVELILAQDPDGTYLNMDKESKNYYRRQVGLLARRYRVPEPRVARIAVGLAKQVDDRELPSSHVGYYLIGKGREKLLRQLNGSAQVTRMHNYPPARYYSAVAGLMAAVVVPLAWYGYRFSQGSLVVAVSIVLLSLLPVSEIAVF